MADLQLLDHPLVRAGPTGIDDTGQEWLNGERPMLWREGDAHRRQFGKRGEKMVQKDDWVGWLDGSQHPNEEIDGEDMANLVLQPGFAAEREPIVDPFERPGESWRITEFYQSDRRTSMGEGSQPEEVLNAGLPLTTVQQFDCSIFSRKIFPTIGQEIVLEEDRRILPEVLRKLNMKDAQELTERTTDQKSVGEIAWRWRLSRKGRSGFPTYAKWMRTRRAACRWKFPGLQNLLWYLDSTKTWMRIGRISVRGTMSVTGLQLLIAELWGPGYSLHQRREGSWFNRATAGGPDRILHLTLKCQHTDSTQAEGVEGSRCWMCGMVCRLFEMGFIDTAHFFRYIEPQHMLDVFENIYSFACRNFHEQIFNLITHLGDCDMHHSDGYGEELTPEAASRQNRACFSKHDASVKAADVRLMAQARKRLAWHTDYTRELLLCEGSVLDSAYEQEASIDMRGEDDWFDWDVNW